MSLEGLIRLPGVPFIWQVTEALGLGNTSQKGTGSDIEPASELQLDCIDGICQANISSVAQAHGTSLDQP